MDENDEILDCGHRSSEHTSCYCFEDQGSGWTYVDEYGACDFCLEKQQ